MSVDVQRPGSKRDAKAELKAAKAYAKAQRPWYKKKRWLLSLGFVLLIVGAAAGSSGTNTGETAANADGASQATSEKDSGDDATTGKVGEQLTNAGTTYEVTGVRTASTIGDPDVLGQRADGKFVIVDLALTNNKDETKTFTQAAAHIATADGKKYETTDTAVLAFGDESLLMRDIQPELTARGKLAFDLPPSKIDGAKLVIEDLSGNGEITVDLDI